MVRVQPGARRDELVGPYGETLKLKVSAPPVAGQANSRVEELIAELLEVPRSSVSLVSGHQSRTKTVAIEGVDMATVRTRLKRYM